MQAEHFAHEFFCIFFLGIAGNFASVRINHIGCTTRFIIRFFCNKLVCTLLICQYIKRYNASPGALFDQFFYFIRRLPDISQRLIHFVQMWRCHFYEFGIVCVNRTAETYQDYNNSICKTRPEMKVIK